MSSSALPPVVVEALACEAALSRRELLALGARDADLRRGLRSGAVVRPRPGYYCQPVSSTGDTALDAELLALRGAVASGSDVVVSHRSAARLWRLPVWGRNVTAEVTRRYGTAGIPGVVVHRYAVVDPEPVVRMGLPTTSAERTVIDVCRTASMSAALATVDAALGTLGLEPARIEKVLDTLGDVNHRNRTKQVLAWGDPLAENAFESFSRGQLLLEGLPAPLLQWWVGDGAGTWFRPDKLWPHLGLLAEADGRWKYRQRREEGPRGATVDPLIWEKDRQDWFSERDFETVRFGPERIARRPYEVADRWRALCERQQRRGWQWPAGVWLVEPGPWPPRRPFIKDESARLSVRPAA